MFVYMHVYLCVCMHACMLVSVFSDPWVWAQGPGCCKDCRGVVVGGVGYIYLSFDLYLYLSIDLSTYISG